MLIMSYKFRPEEVIHYRLNFPGKNLPKRYPSAQWAHLFPLNIATLMRLAGIIHYHDSHAPKKTRSRWKQASVRLRKRYPMRGSDRFYNRSVMARIA